jgi:isopentenyldiphosphate isomerase
VYDADGEHVLNLDGVGVNTFSIINYAYHIIAYSATDERLRY